MLHHLCGSLSDKKESIITHTPFNSLILKYDHNQSPHHKEKYPHPPASSSSHLSKSTNLITSAFACKFYPTGLLKTSTYPPPYLDWSWNFPCMVGFTCQDGEMELPLPQVALCPINIHWGRVRMYCDPCAFGCKERRLSAEKMMWEYWAIQIWIRNFWRFGSTANGRMKKKKLWKTWI